MTGNDVRILRDAAVPAAVAGLAAALISWLVAGPKGALGAVVGILLVAAFFSVSLIAVAYAARISPGAMMGAALGSYLVKIIALGVAMSLLQGVTIWNFQALAWTVIIGTLVWTIAEGRALWKSKVLIVDPSSDPPWVAEAVKRQKTGGAHYD